MPQPENETLKQVFAETNEYLRAADVKQLQLTAGFMGLATGVVALMLGEKGGALLVPSPTSLLIYGLLTLLGYATFVVLRWYRAWKVHYMNVLKSITTQWAIDNAMLPFWMRGTQPIDDKLRTSWSVDDTFTYLIGLVGSALGGITANNAVALLVTTGNRWPQWTAMIVVGVLFLFLYLHTYRWMFSRTEYLSA